MSETPDPSREPLDVEAWLAALGGADKVARHKLITDAVGWKPGQKLVPIVEGNAVVLVAAPSLEDMRGFVRPFQWYDTYRDRRP